MIAEVLPTANLDTADQLFSNNVSIGDDRTNGPDVNTANNQDSESDMLLAGAGEPLILTALPESIGAPPESISAFESGRGDALQRAELPNTQRIVTTDFFEEQDEQKRIRIGENDLINGGHLLDTFATAHPVILCEPHYISYDYHSDTNNLELLEWLDVPAEEQSANESLLENLPSEQAGEHGADNQAGHGSAETSAENSTEKTGQLLNKDAAKLSLQDQLAFEAENLHAAGKQAMIKAFKESL